MDRMSHEIMSLSIPTLFRRIMGKDCAGYLIDIRNDEEAANADRESDIRAARADHLEPVEAAQPHDVPAI
jgi:hypothetical protein